MTTINSNVTIIIRSKFEKFLNDENRQRLQECGAAIRDERKLLLFRQEDITTNYHVSQVLQLRQDLLDALKK